MVRRRRLWISASAALMAVVVASPASATHKEGFGHAMTSPESTALNCDTVPTGGSVLGCLSIWTFALDEAGIHGANFSTGGYGLLGIGHTGVEGRTTSSASGALGVSGRLAVGSPGIGSAAVKGATESTTANGNGAGVWGFHEPSTGTSPGVLGTTLSTSADATAIRGVIQSANPGASATAVRGINFGTAGSGIGVWGSHAGAGWGVFGESASDIGVRGITGSTTHLGAGVYGLHTSLNGASPGVFGRTVSEAPQAAGVIGEVDQPEPGNFASGVRARNHGTTNEGTGLWASHSGGGYGTYSTSVGGTGVSGIHTAGNGTQPGVRGTTFSTTDLAAGVYGDAPNGSQTIGVFGSSAAGFGVLGAGGAAGVLGYNPSGVAGYFVGNAHVTGTLSAGSKAFRIDHPLEPKTKYLQHSTVESPDMKNVYDGVVTTDRRGFATVRLPRYFQALNREFRYQLTLVGKSAWGAQAVVWEEIRDNRFVIRSEPHTRVSWQVTGIRKDAQANAHRVAVEVLKTAAHRDTTSVQRQLVRAAK